MLEASYVSAVSSFGRSLDPALCAATSDSATREHRSQRASPGPAPKRGNGCFLGALTAAEAEVAAPKLPFRSHAAEAVCALEGTPDLRGSGPAYRSRSSRDRRPRSCLPPTSHRSGRKRKTRSGNSTTSPMEFGSFRRMNPGDRCVGLPPRHHPLSEFLTPSAVLARPGLVALFRATSTHRISAFRAFSLSASRDISRCPLLSCRFGQLRLRSSKLELHRRPYRWLLPCDLHSPDRECFVCPCNPDSEPQHQLVSGPTEVSCDSSERLKPPTERMRGLAQRRFPVRKWPFGVPFCRREPTTSERCSDRESVPGCPPLSRYSSRCSLDLFPL